MNGTADNPGHHRFRIGAFDAIALHEGIARRPRPSGFVRNAPDEAVAEAYACLGMAPGDLTITFTALLLDTGDTRILFDTGNGQAASADRRVGRLLRNLEAAGYVADLIDHVVISHFHADHIAGLLDADGAPNFPNATVHVPQPEWDYWTSDAERAAAPERLHAGFDTVARIFDVIGDRRRCFGWGDVVATGVTAMQADGHTPGHTAFDIVSGDARMLYVADITNNPLVFARHPDWQGAWDIRPEDAVATRKRLLGQAADDYLRLFFYHAPFPSNGYVTHRADGGYQFVPALWE